MKILNRILPILFSGLLIWSCSSKPQIDINLNEGEKWEVNSAMKPHIEKGEDILKAYEVNEDQDYLQLANKLKEQNQALIKSCTMKGASHDELHKWLHPHMDLISKLGKAENPEQAESIVDDLEDSFQVFHDFFK